MFIKRKKKPPTINKLKINSFLIIYNFSIKSNQKSYHFNKLLICGLDFFFFIRLRIEGKYNHDICEIYDDYICFVCWVSYRM